MKYLFHELNKKHSEFEFIQLTIKSNHHSSFGQGNIDGRGFSRGYGYSGCHQSISMHRVMGSRSIRF